MNVRAPTLNRLQSGALIVGLGTLAACQPSAATTPVPAATSTCDIVQPAPAHTAITLGVTSAVDSGHAPAARNAAERLVFAQLYETLVRIDCTGAVAAGLASEWSSADGRVWRLRLRPDASFHDGTPVTARSVLDSWSAAGSTGPIAAATALGPAELRIELREPYGVADLASPLLAIARHSGSAWPIGSAEFHPATGGSASQLRLVRAYGRGGVDTIGVRVFAGDPRNALDAGVDALLSADPAVLAYARARSDYRVVPLLWSRSYAVFTHARADSTAPPPAAALATLADAVHDARPAAGPLPWAACHTSTLPAARRTGPSRAIVYARDDVTARTIAERIAALAWPASSAPAWVRDLLPAGYAVAGAPLATGIDVRGLADTLRTRAPLAVVAALPRGPGCGTGLGPADPAAFITVARTHGWNAVPLLDTRDYLIHRDGIGPVRVDGDGSIRFVGVR